MNVLVQLLIEAIREALRLKTQYLALRSTG